MRKFRLLVPVFALLAVLFQASPTNASILDSNTCVINSFQIWFSDNLYGSAPGLLHDTQVLGSNRNSADCQAFVQHYDSSILKSETTKLQHFAYQLLGNAVPSDSVCQFTMKVNGHVWLEDQTQFEPGQPNGHAIWMPTLSTGVKNSFANLLNLGANEVSGSIECSNYPQANQTLSATLNVVEDSFDDFSGLTINEAADYTNSSQVKLNLSFEDGVPGLVMISNDGSFPASKRKVFTYKQNTVDWTLSTLYGGSATRTVYVKFKFFDRYTGELKTRWSATVSDDIILDDAAPTLTSASASSVAPTVTVPPQAGIQANIRMLASNKSVSVKVKAKDARSGVSKVQYGLSKNAQALTTRKFAKNFTISLPESSSTFYMRVSDRAGNWSSWKKVSIKTVR